MMNRQQPLAGAPRAMSAVTGDELRELARAGTLVSTYAEAGPAEAYRLRAAALDLCFRLVFDHHTRRLERERGHRMCAASPTQLEPACHDRFEDDALAVTEYALAYARSPIENLDGWIVSRIGKATVDGYRRRRGEVGALQRPRVPAWLSTALGEDPWLTTLALLIMEWVGVPATAGHRIWPLDAWSERRAAVLGPSTPTMVESDVQSVLAVMRHKRPRWYADYIERPLGHKPFPLVPAEDVDNLLDPTVVIGPGGTVHSDHPDRRLDELGSVALESILDWVALGARPETAIRSVLSDVFLTASTTAASSTRARIARLLQDEVATARVVTLIEDLATAS